MEQPIYELLKKGRKNYNLAKPFRLLTLHALDDGGGGEENDELWMLTVLQRICNKELQPNLALLVFLGQGVKRCKKKELNSIDRTMKTRWCVEEIFAWKFYMVIILSSFLNHHHHHHAKGKISQLCYLTRLKSFAPHYILPLSYWLRTRNKYSKKIYHRTHTHSHIILQAP